MRVHHVGYLTKNLEKTRARFTAMGFEVERPVKYDEIRGINIEFLTNDGYRVELIEPVSKESPMYPLLKHYRNTPYHFCYVVNDIDKAIKELEAERYHVINETAPAPCIDNDNVCFLMHKDMGIIELVEQE